MSNHFFLAIPIAENLRSLLYETTDPFLESVCYKRRTDPRDYHITLFFFGGVDEERQENLNRTVARVTEKISAFQVILTGIDGFGEKHHPRVLFASLAPNHSLEALREKLSRELAEIGFVTESRPFHPHITLAKRWIEGELYHDLPVMDCAVSGKSWEVNGISLFRVRPGMSPQYQSVANFPFRNK
ncbi:RNA 2',3'-cyclic phosphodiesterase [Sporolactobacillus nakayamae]|uniref:RNA 2',3'-cyclic phosphodiesterase n=1 Tax=Sporolactobacillus nakayamae TaxID=269670 RepID=A0A1I2RXC0_9BACL|nr:RNA 2',3'-cyclic phosphodiesterase [Sporolactobacillus nakayamae]SFG42411.1 2'-5' RNA ligase [Sporolactobacillus nakayamae]